jgi:4-alpha-glucanotransferase
VCALAASPKRLNREPQEGFAWWTRRLRRSCRLYDETRIDHFRGLAGYWAVDASSDTAKFGKWKVRRI